MSATIQARSESLRDQAETLIAQGDFGTAEQCLADLLGKFPTDDSALALMAEVRLRGGHVHDAFALYMRAVSAAPEVHLYKERFLELAGRGLNVAHSEQLETAVVACLKTPDLAGAVENWASLLMANLTFAHAQRGFSEAHSRHAPLAHYAFLPISSWKKRNASRSASASPSDRVGNGWHAAIALFSCYRPLCLLANAEEILEAFKDVEILSDVIKAQIADHRSLCQVAASLPALKPIADETSLKVREQYEAFPYPRWKTLSKGKIAQNWQAEEFSQRLEASLLKGSARILIAGCGTGRDAAIHSVRFPGASITAVDISRTSLAYASIKAKELGLGNLAFVHGDILDLGRMGQTFDYICCTGVLHHMENPVAGWRVLRDLLNPGGLMRIGLYSRAGRKAVAAAQDAARRGNYPPTREGILRFRRDCPHICDRETLLCLSQLQDYYHMNMYRDLLFPAREHRFDLAQIRDMLSELGLSFEGFYLSAEVLTQYRSIFRDDRNATNLECWRQFESRYPDTFASMYIFWCRKNPSRAGAAQP
jgi:SAM-dependent methyltransferase